MKNISLFQKKLLGWYLASRRPLPWRETRDPYAIWISEVLLQQTRVNTALSYYQRFLERFPTLDDLAEAPIDAVLRIWQGLGYYGRARNLHRAARIVRDEFGGSIPTEPEALERLPGIGPYTAAAIASIAFGRDVAVLDGNVARVLCRAMAIHGIPNRPSTKRRLHHLANRLLPKGEAAAFNQALMELGALVCKPGRPDCPACPVRGVCVAYREGKVERLPLRTSRTELPVRVRVTAAIKYRGRLLLGRRDLEGFLGGLWEFPGAYLEGKESNDQGLKRLKDMVGNRLSRFPESESFSVQHVYSHFEEKNRVFVCEGSGGANRGSEQRYRWVYPTRLDPYPITGATRKILRKLERGRSED